MAIGLHRVGLHRIGLNRRPEDSIVADRAQSDARNRGHGAMTNTIIRGGRLLDIGRHAAEPADILVAGDTVREVGPPGMAAPSDAAALDASGRLLMPGLVNAHTHGHNNLAKSPRRSLDTGAAAQRRALDHRRPDARGQVPLHPHRRGGDGAQGMHRRLRPELRVPRSDARKVWKPSAGPTRTPECARWWPR